MITNAQYNLNLLEKEFKVRAIVVSVFTLIALAALTTATLALLNLYGFPHINLGCFNTIGNTLGMGGSWAIGGIGIAISLSVINGIYRACQVHKKLPQARVYLQFARYQQGELPPSEPLDEDDKIILEWLKGKNQKLYIWETDSKGKESYFVMGQGMKLPYASMNEAGGVAWHHQAFDQMVYRIPSSKKELLDTIAKELNS